MSAKPRLILHGGMPKTASTAIQEALLSMPVGEKGVLYPETGRYPGSVAHHEMFFALSGSSPEVKMPLPAPRASFEFLVEDLRKEIARSNASVVVISTEILWNPLAVLDGHLRMFRDYFDDFEIDILFYLRSPVKQAVSGYAQRVSGVQKYTGTFSDHVADMLSAGVWDYSARLDVFRRVFGDDRVHAHSFDQVRDDILAPLVVLMETDIAKRRVPQSNVRKNWTSIALLRKRNVCAAGGKILCARVMARAAALLERAARRSDMVRRVLDRMGNPMRIEHVRILQEQESTNR